LRRERERARDAVRRRRDESELLRFRRTVGAVDEAAAGKIRAARARADICPSPGKSVEVWRQELRLWFGGVRFASRGRREVRGDTVAMGPTHQWQEK
jgi:hypothetical protein